MAVFHVTALIALILFIAYKEKETILDVIPTAVCLLILVLYGLSFGGRLLLSDYFALIFCLLTAVFFMRKPGEKKQEILQYCFQELKRPETIAAVILLTAVPLLTGSKAVTWWDDINFWATDVKSIFNLNGFAGKYRNVAPEFGDYPPGTQMLKWWFLHMEPHRYREGAIFSGYYFMNLAFLVPLLKFLKNKSRILAVPAAAALWLFPSCAEVFGYDGCCADLTMAVIYGLFLAAVVERKGHSPFFYYGRLSLLLAVLVLCKNVGFLWAAFGLVFLYGYHILMRKTADFEAFPPKVRRRGLLLTTLAPVLTEGSWLSFCLLNRRVARLTGAALHMATGSMNIPALQKEMVQAYVTAFLIYPLHRWRTFALDLSPLMLYVLLLFFLFLLYKRGKVHKAQGLYFGSFLAVSGICFYALNLLSHLTIFAVETQYLEPFGMVSSIERYGAPFTIGGLYLTAFLTMRQAKEAGADTGVPAVLTGTAEKCRGFAKKNAGILLCLAFVLLTADYGSAYRGLFGYRKELSKNRQAAEDMIDEKAENFLLRTGAGEKGSSKRVLYLRDVSEISWVRNAYVSYAAAPVSVLYGNIDAKITDSAGIITAIGDAHAGFLYADEIADGQKLFAPLTEDKDFTFGCLYKIEEENGRILLKKAETESRK